MSLWYESLAFSLHDCGGNPKERAKCIFSFLSMPVPRSWWENALRTGRVDDTHASVLHKLRVELSNVIDIGEPVGSGLLVALAFADEESTESALDAMNSKTTVHDYLVRAKMVLAKRPELAQLGGLIDEKEGSFT